ncbi:unnamed protein product [Spodoptera littoralis]|uniref:Uncharacterized protein n=1 Tax=Spodoptera littoralis TaxID=7109 RepID=A0A9P0I114_SPOLI|nr:unnamed protein product [Spodoptera littoralis]CAH1637531.1 unnamed protein product [Spodoptera littoralis]
MHNSRINRSTNIELSGVLSFGFGEVYVQHRIETSLKPWLQNNIPFVIFYFVVTKLLNLPCIVNFNFNENFQATYAMDSGTFAILLELIMLWTAMLPECGRANSTVHPLIEMKKKRFRFKYNPHKGYEPYWVGGEKVMSTTSPKPGTTTTVAPLICGYDCNYIYQRIKEVCTVLVNRLISVQCWWCTGKPGYQLSKTYVTMTYCDFLGIQCQEDKFSDDAIMFVNLGKCKKDDEMMKPAWDPRQAVSRMQWYLTSFDKQEDPFKTTAAPSTTKKPKKKP